MSLATGIVHNHVAVLHIAVYINDVQKLVRERTTGIYNLGEAEARVRD